MVGPPVLRGAGAVVAVASSRIVRRARVLHGVWPHLMQGSDRCIIAVSHRQPRRGDTGVAPLIRHSDASLVGGVAVSRVSCTSNSAIAAMTPTPGERPVGPAAVEGRPRSNKSTMATTLVSGQLNMTQKLLAGFEQRRVDSAVASRATPTNSGAVAGQAPSPQAARRPLALGESGRRGNLDRPRFRQSGPVPPGFADPCCPYRGRGRHHRPR
jgi:hypothetical protein